MNDSIDWEALWQSLQPGELFDALKPLPVLEAFISTSKFPPGALALVPGCGRGYDLELLARSGKFAHVVGLDISENATLAARNYLESKAVPSDRYQLVSGDFFNDFPSHAPFHLVYDYTFLCALPLQLRPAWAQRMSQLLAPDGLLVTVIFPQGKPLASGGPPFGLVFDDYVQLLPPLGFKCVEGPVDLSNEHAHDGRGDAKTGWAVWKKVSQQTLAESSKWATPPQ